MKHLTIKSFLLLVTMLLQFLTLFSPVLGSSQNSMVIDANSNETQRISILVGKSSGNIISPLAEGDPPEDGEDAGADQPPATGYDWCQGNRCCYQFTWQGYVQEIPSDPANTTCTHLKAERKADDMACFDPIIYTTADGGGTARGRSPNVTHLEQQARENNWNVYCPLTQDKSCLTLKYFSRGGGKQVVNETRFCGSVTETISGGRLSSGCWAQDVQGYVREVCACTTSLCNSGRSLRLPEGLLSFVIILGTLVSIAFTKTLL